MKKFIFLAAFMSLLVHGVPAYAYTVYCTNCSDKFTQALERVTNIDQLKTLMNQYQEDIQQTTQQIRMVQQNVEQYANMLQNTAQLPQNLVNELKGNLTRLASLSSQLKTERGDMVSLGDVFNNLYPEQASFGNMAGATPEQMEAANAQYHKQWDEWAKNVDRSTQATFQLSGQQLDDLQKDPEKFQGYIDNLLSTPDGQQKAIMAGNQLAAVQVQEARQLRELIATQAQSTVAAQAKSEKEDQKREEQWRSATSGYEALINAKSRKNLFESQ